MALLPVIFVTYNQRVGLVIGQYDEGQWVYQTDDSVTAKGYYQKRSGLWVLDNASGSQIVTSAQTLLAKQTFSEALAINKNAVIGETAGGGVGGATGALGIADAAVAPTVSPTSGGIVYSVSGVLYWMRSDGTLDRLGGRRLFYSSAIDVVKNNTAAEETLFTIPIPAGLLYRLGANQIVAVRAYYSFKQNTGSNRTTTIRLKYGATTFFTITSQPQVSSANVGGGHIDILLRGDSSVNAQRCIFEMNNGRSDDVFIITSGAMGTAAEDSSLEKNLVLTTQFSVADANMEIGIRAVMAELIG